MTEPKKNITGGKPETEWSWGVSDLPGPGLTAYVPEEPGEEPEPVYVFILQLTQFGTRILHAAIDQPGAEVLQALCGFRARRSAIRLGLTVQPVNCGTRAGLQRQREEAKRQKK